MAQRIVWSKEAQDDFLATLGYYAERNGSKTYSEKLAKQIQEVIERLREHPLLGRPTNDEEVRILRKGNYQIYYELKNDEIVILVVWDMRRNPEELKRYVP
ncbi:MAG: type II toxin-antitoxin system RelE/ParE family toxin [Tunicatimonas sp.]|uniref:type II toxin-antitoxin system RelE/ParE family toxin n=1 Tax=Tunicatimonas sp. TaxID=1940096 RepID=UPI003C780FA0